MPIVIDGNNLLHTLPSGQRSRAVVRQKVLDLSRREKISVTIVFDGPPPDGSPSSEHLGSVTVLYSGKSSADDVIMKLVPPGSAARSWSVVTNDRGLGLRVRERGASVRTLDQWAGRRGARPRQGKPRPRPPLRTKEVLMWEEEFSKEKEIKDDGPTRVFKTRRRH